MVDVPQLMQQAMTALKSGDKAQAKDKLMQVVQADEHNEQAWLWLAGAIDDPVEQRICLENVLHLNPQNTRAQQGLTWLRSKHPQVFEELPAAPAPAATGPTVQLDASAVPAAPAAPAPTTAAAPVIPAAPPPNLPAAAAPPQSSSPTYQVPAADGRAIPGSASICPRCGQLVPIKRTSCNKCGLSLMEKIPRGKTNSAPAKIAGIMGMLHSVIMYVLIGLFAMALIFSAWNKAKRIAIASAGENPAQISRVEAQLDQFYTQGVEPVVTQMTIYISIGIIGIVICVGLMRRRGWAYWAGLIFFGLHLIIYTLVLIRSREFFILMEQVAAGMPQINGNPGALATVQKVIDIMRLIVFGFFMWFLVIMTMLIISFKAFTRQKVRLIVDDTSVGDAETHFNRGVAYRKRQYWYQTMREWEKAVDINPMDATYRHALAMIYEQLKRPADALNQLDEALKIAPDNASINQDRQRLAAKLAHGGA